LTGVSSFWRSFNNVFLKRRASKATATPPPAAKYTARDLVLILSWQFALIGGLSWFVAWWAYPVLWLVPLYCFAFVPDNLRAFAEHSQPEPDSSADTHRLITFASHPLERLFLAPLNMNYHAAHHLWPSIPYYHLPLADREMRRLAGAAGLEWRGTYIGYLARYFRLLPLEDCRQAAQAA
jgi:fatty acid desaturase